MNLGFDLAREAAKPKRATEDAPTQVPMRPAKLRRNPDTGQKKVRRQQARKTASDIKVEVMGDVEIMVAPSFVGGEANRPSNDDTPAWHWEVLDRNKSSIGVMGQTVDDGYVDTEAEAWAKARATADAYAQSSGRLFASRQTKESHNVNFNQREAELLSAMGRASLADQQVLAAELESVRAMRREALQSERDVDIANGVVRDHLTPVLTHGLNTTSTDWLGEMDEDDIDVEGAIHRARAEAGAWFERTSSDVRADRTEFAEQAQGKARVIASQYGSAAPEAQRAFLDTVAFLHRRTAENVDPLPDSGSGPQQPNTTPWSEKMTTGDAGADEDRPSFAEASEAGQPYMDDPTLSSLHDAVSPPRDSNQGGGYWEHIHEHGTPSQLKPTDYDDVPVRGYGSEEIDDEPRRRRSSLHTADDSPGKVDEDQSGNAESTITDYEGNDKDREPFDTKQTGVLPSTGPVEVPSTRAPNVTGSRDLATIAADVIEDWDDAATSPAAPYLAAMVSMGSVNDAYGSEPGQAVVAYFLRNSGSWRGRTAQAVRSELVDMLDPLYAKVASMAVDRSGDNSSHDVGATCSCGFKAKTAVGWQDHLIKNVGNGPWDPDHPKHHRVSSLTAADKDDTAQSGDAGSSLDEVEVGNPNDRPPWPWEMPNIGNEGPATGDNAANVSGVPTPGGESGYPQPKKSAGVDNFGDKKAPPFTKGDGDEDDHKESSLIAEGADTKTCPKCSGTMRAVTGNAWLCDRCGHRAERKYDPDKPYPGGREGSLVAEGEYHYVHKRGDKWVITQKGTGKVLSTHDSEDQAKASFRAMMRSKHGGSLIDQDRLAAFRATVAANVGRADPFVREGQGGGETQSIAGFGGQHDKANATTCCAHGVAMHDSKTGECRLCSCKQLQRAAAYNPFTDQNNPYVNPLSPADKAKNKQWREVFPEGVPLHGDLTPEQERELKRRGSRVTAASNDYVCKSCGYTDSTGDENWLTGDEDIACPRCHSTNVDTMDAQGLPPNGTAGPERLRRMFPLGSLHTADKDDDPYHNPDIKVRSVHPRNFGGYVRSGGDKYEATKAWAIHHHGEHTDHYVADTNVGKTVVDSTGQMQTSWHVGVGPGDLARVHYNLRGGFHTKSSLQAEAGYTVTVRRLVGAGQFEEKIDQVSEEVFNSPEFQRQMAEARGAGVEVTVTHEGGLQAQAGDWTPGEVRGRMKPCPRCGGGGYEYHGATSKHCNACQGVGSIPAHVRDNEVTKRFGPPSAYQRRKGSLQVTAGETHYLELPYSEVCMSMGVAGHRMPAEYVGSHMVQLLNPDGSPFSFPITEGEAGWGMPGFDLGVLPDDGPIPEFPPLKGEGSVTAASDFQCGVCKRPATHYAYQDPGHRAAGHHLCAAHAVDARKQGYHVEAVGASAKLEAFRATVAQSLAANVSDYKVGDRVELHPATDAWMFGDRYGEVAKVGREKVHIKMDRSGRTLRMHPHNIRGKVD